MIVLVLMNPARAVPLIRGYLTFKLLTVTSCQVVLSVCFFALPALPIMRGKLKISRPTVDSDSSCALLLS